MPPIVIESLVNRQIRYVIEYLTEYQILYTCILTNHILMQV